MKIFMICTMATMLGFANFTSDELEKINTAIDPSGDVRIVSVSTEEESIKRIKVDVYREANGALASSTYDMYLEGELLTIVVEDFISDYQHHMDDKSQIIESETDDYQIATGNNESGWFSKIIRKGPASLKCPMQCIDIECQIMDDDELELKQRFIIDNSHFVCSVREGMKANLYSILNHEAGAVSFVMGMAGQGVAPEKFLYDFFSYKMRDYLTKHFMVELVK